MSTTELGNKTAMKMDAENSGSLTLKDVYKMLEKEIETPTLQSIEPDTFQKIADALGEPEGPGIRRCRSKGKG